MTRFSEQPRPSSLHGAQPLFGERSKSSSRIENDKHLLIGGNYYQELYACLYLFGVRTVDWNRDPETYARPGELDTLRRSFLRDWSNL